MSDWYLKFVDEEQAQEVPTRPSMRLTLSLILMTRCQMWL